MFHRIQIFKSAVVLVAYLVIQLILHQLEMIQYMDQIRISAINQNDFRGLSNNPENQSVSEDFDIVIVIQVQNNQEHLKTLLKSLESADKIEKSLLIFSHSTPDKNIANLVRMNSSSFAKIHEIFFFNATFQSGYQSQL